MIMANVIIVTLGALFFACAYLFGFKKTVFNTYYALKYVLFKPLEWLARLILAMVQISVYVWASWALLLIVAEILMSEPEAFFVMFLLLMVYGWFVLLLIWRNFHDEDDKDCVRMMLAQLEHKLCFKNPKLSMYPNDWHWFEQQEIL